jgi:DNA recombination protein RmuC
LADHFAETGKGLKKATESYNKAVGSLEGRVLVTTRRFKDLGAATADDIAVLEGIDQTPRLLQAPDFKVVSPVQAATAPTVLSESPGTEAKE